jgi:hypothetical protein
MIGPVSRLRAWVARMFGPGPRCVMCGAIASESEACPECVVYAMEATGSPPSMFDPFQPGGEP